MSIFDVLGEMRSHNLLNEKAESGLIAAVRSEIRGEIDRLGYRISDHILRLSDIAVISALEMGKVELCADIINRLREIEQQLLVLKEQASEMYRDA